MKLQLLQDKVLRTIRNYPRRTSVRDLHMAFQISFVYDYITIYGGNKQESYKIMVTNVCTNGQGEAFHRKYKRFILGGSQA
jgi:hypothetical protein